MSRHTASDDLMNLARVLPQDRDATLLRATTGLFCQEAHHDRDAVRRFEELALYFLPKAGIGDRIHVATLLARRGDAPASVVRALARDRIEVATPVLCQSTVLTTIDLLGVIATTGAEHHALIAGRPGISADVSRALALARGQAETLPAPVIAVAITAAVIGSDIPAQRVQLEAAFAPKPVAAPVDAMAEEPTETDEMGEFLALPGKERLQRLAEMSERHASRQVVSQPRRIERVLRHAFACAELVAAARTGNRRRVVAAFAEILEIETVAVERLLDDPSGEPLVLMIKGSGLKDTDGRIVLLLANPEIGQSVESFFRLAELYASLDTSVAETFLAAWRPQEQPRAPQHMPVFAENRSARREPMARPAPSIEQGGLRKSQAG